MVQRRWFLAGALLLVGAALFIYRYVAPGEPAATPADVHAQGSLEPARGHAGSGRTRPVLASDKVRTVLDRYPEGHVMRDILQRNDHLVTLLDFKNRPLLDSIARQERERFLSSEETLGVVRDALLKPGALAYSLADGITREMNVDYLDMAMRWGQNPMRGRLLDVLEEIVLRDNFVEAQDEFVERSVAHSKVALLKLLYEADGARARGVAARARGTRMEALIAYGLAQAGYRP